MPASQGQNKRILSSRKTAAKLHGRDHMTVYLNIYMHTITLYISVTTLVLHSKFHLTFQINPGISENTTGSIDFDIES